MGRVTLIGAGCGSYDLLTIRGRAMVQEADCILYDALIDPRILSFASPSCEQIAVGKRSGHALMSQDQINALLLQKAGEHAHVVRLKGGDPFVLGRGGEEALFLRRHGVDVTFVPGISSAIAALEAAGIPPTHRTLAFGFHVMDGHDPSRIAFDALVQDGNTCVFLMGLSHLDEIVQGLLKAGMDAQVPSAVISQGAKRGQRVLCAPLHELPQRVHAAKLCAPAIIVTGECVRLHAQLSVPRPLQGVRIGIAAYGSGQKLEDLLEAQGALTTQLCSAQVSFCLDALDALCLDAYDWLILTSPRAASAFVRWMRSRQIDLRRLAHLKLAVVGSACARICQDVLLQPDVVAGIQDSAHLGDALAQQVKEEDTLLHLCAEEHGDELAQRFGAQLKTAVVYHMERRACPVTEGELDQVVFTCASAARDCAHHVGSAYAVAIGQKCADELRRQGVQRIITASEHSLQGCVEALIQNWEERT